MRQTTRLVTLAAAVAVAVPPAAMFSNGAGSAGAWGPDGGGGTVLAFSQMLRRCDFSETDYNGPTGFARPTGVLRSSGTSVSADIQIATAVPYTHYDVRLIQTPRPASMSCIGGDPGVAIGALNTDGVGAAATTVQGPVAPGATKVWVFISRPDAFSQNPKEFYTSDLEVAI